MYFILALAKLKSILLQFLTERVPFLRLELDFSFNYFFEYSQSNFSRVFVFLVVQFSRCLCACQQLLYYITFLFICQPLFRSFLKSFIWFFLEVVVSNFIIISHSLSFVKCFLKVFYENFFRSRCDTFLLYHFFAVLSSAFQAFFQNRSLLEALYPLPSQTAYLLYHFISPLSTLFASFCVFDSFL